MVKRIGNSLEREERETNRWGRKGCKPKGSYKEVPRPSRGLALAAAKRSLTTRKFKSKKLVKIDLQRKKLYIYKVVPPIGVFIK